MTAGTSLESGHTMLIIELTLVVVGKDLVSLGDSLEADFGVGALVFGNFVGMGG